jgi:hypothetical protein
MIGEWLGNRLGRSSDLETRLVLSLPSRSSGYRFQATIRVCWSTRIAQRERLEPLVIQSVRKIVQDALCRHEILDWKVAQQDAEADLARRIPVHVKAATILRADVVVDLEAGCREDALRLESLVRQHSFEELTRAHARARVAFLRKEVLADPANMKLYLLAMADGLVGKPLRAEELAPLIEEVAWWAPDSRWLNVARLVHGYLSQLSRDEERALLKAFTAAVEAIGDRDFADKLCSELGDESTVQR